MQLYQIKEGVCPYISFPVLEELPWLIHGVSTRLGGVSGGIYESMNLGYKNGDKKEAVDENYRRICESLSISTESLVLAQQTHGTNIRVVTKQDRGKGHHIERDYCDIDALITKEAGTTLVILTADCVPVFIVDTKTHAAGLAHSGWKGTVNRITAKTIQAMQQEFGTDPAKILVVTGPCICKDCYEVSQDVAEQFEQTFTKAEYQAFAAPAANDKTLLNLSEAIRQSVLPLGVKDSNIVQSNLCTACNPTLLFSHRVTQGKRGTLASFLQIKA